MRFTRVVRHSLFIPLILLLFAFPKPVFSQCACDHVIPNNVVYINGNDSAFQFQPGDVVCLEAGQKSELWILNVHGAPNNPITFKNCGGKVTLQQPNLYSYVLKVSDSDHIRVSGSGDPAHFYGIEIIGEGTEDSGSGIELDGIYNQIELDHLEITNTEFAGIWAKEMPFDCNHHRGNFTLFDLKIHHNFIHDIGTEAIYINRESAPYLSAQMDCGGNTIYPYGLEGLRIYNNHILRTGWDAMDVDAANWDGEIYNNLIDGYGLSGDPGQQKGIYLGEGTTGKCYNNTLKNGLGEGIVLDGFGNNKVYNNIIDKTARQGIICRERIAPNFGEYEIMHNTIISPGYDGIIINSPITGNFVYNNIIIDPSNIEFITLNNGASAFIEGNYLDMNVYNAQFENEAIGDYRLRPVSPLINQGFDVSTYNLGIDIMGNNRLAHGAYDIGAHELQTPAGSIIPPSTSGKPPFNAHSPNSIPPYTGLFRYGSNMGYYPGWTDEALGDIAAGNPAVGQQGLGARTLRPSLPEYLVDNFGYRVRINTFEHYKSLGMDDHTLFLGFPADDGLHRDPNSYCQDGSQSWLFDNMYEPIWDNGEGGTPVNEDNYYALYVWKTVFLYRDYIKFWQIINEPDFDGGGAGWFPPASEDPAFAATNWWDNDPDPCVLGNMQAPVQHYIRMLRISYEIIHSLAPDDYVVLGGIGYESFLDAILRNTDNPGWHDPEGVGSPGDVTAEYPFTGGAYFDIVTFHLYPQFAETIRFYDIDHFEYRRNSDAAVQAMINKKNGFEQVMLDRGYDGQIYPKKLYTVTEMNISRQPFPYTDPGSAGENYIGGDEVQRNFIIKAFITAQMNEIEQLYIYNLGDEVKEWEASNSFHLMGLYENLDNVPLYTQQIHSAGIAFRTVATELYGYTYDPTRTAALNLPFNVKGGAFQNPDGHYKYVLWAETVNDLSEYAFASYSFPAALDYGEQGIIAKAWDHGQNPNGQTISASGIALGGAPIVFEEIPNGGSVFPVEFLTFEAQPLGSQVKLSWATASEQNNHYFTIERSTDRRIFTPIDRVNSFGNSLSKQEYQSFDASPLEGKTFYRIKQTDFDGSFSYGPTVEVQLDGLGVHAVNIFPIPLKIGQALQIEMDLPAERQLHFKLVDALGRVMHQESETFAAGVSLSYIPTHQLQAGIYYLAIEDGDGYKVAYRRVLVMQ